ncbi:MAG: hypothetical protein RMJ19_03480 [Gemmatales bacterium]|nr:hypothetical protein [Gemmatales bacterium]MDW8174707.1 hypothetical protein [Gemmatales bacterium]
MKLDKDTLIKQRFWFLLPLVFVLIFLALGSVWSISSEADRMNEEVKKKYEQLQGQRFPVSTKLLELLRQEREKARELRWRMWTIMFDAQNDVIMEDGQPVIRRYLIQWPDHPSLQRFATMDFGEPFDRDEFPHNDFRTHFQRLYENLLDILPLYDEKTGRGAVRVAPVVARGGSGPGSDAGFSRPGSGPGSGAPGVATAKSTREMMLELLDPITFGEGNLTTDEIWYALEEVAIKRLILQALREVLDDFAVLRPEFVPLGEAETGAPPGTSPDKSKPDPSKPSPGKPAAAGTAASGPSPVKTAPAEAPPASDKPKDSPKAPAPPLPQKTTTPPEPSKSDSSSGKVPDGKAEPDNPGKKADPAAPPEAKPAPEKTPPRSLIVRQRFYNTVWYCGTLGELTEADAQQPLPILERNEGWVLDVRVTAEMNPDGRPKQFFLEIVSQNYSPRFDIPAMPLRIWLETTSGQRLAVTVPDAGSVPKAQPEPVKPEQAAPALATLVPTVHKPSERVLEAIPLTLPPSDKPDQKGAPDDVIDAVLGVQRVPTGKEVLDYQRFANPHWVVDLQLQRARSGIGFELVGQIYNRSGRRQTPPALEVVLSADGKNEPQETRKEFRPGKKPIDAFQLEKFEESLGILPHAPRQLASVRQVLDWQSTPIKRIDVLYLGERALAQADRLWTTPLFIYPFHLKAQNRSNILDYSDAIKAATSGGRGGGPGPGGGIPGKPGGPPAGGGGGTAPGGMDASQMGPQRREGGEVSRNGIPLRRYFPANPNDTRAVPGTVPEVRRVPVALVLIVDYPAIPDILVALANSPLRVQVTQSVFSRYPPLGPPSLAPGSKPAEATGAIPGTGGDVVGSESAESALVELQVYGFASIYENPYFSRDWQSAGSSSGGGPGPRFGPPPGGGKPPVFRPSGDNRDPRSPGRPGRGGSRGRR